MRLKGSVVGAVAVGLVLLGVAEAFALPVGLRLRVEELGSGTGVVITDGSGGDANALAGIITFAGTIGGFTVNVTTGQSKPFLPTTPAFLAQMRLDSIHVQCEICGPNSVRVTLEDDGFTNGVGQSGLSFASAAGGDVTGNVNVKVNTWYDSTNDVPALGSNVGPVAGGLGLIGPIPGTATPGLGVGGFTFVPGTTAPAAYSTNGTVGFFSAVPYAMFTQVQFDFLGVGGDAGIQASMVVLPEPATLTLLGVGLVGMLIGVHRKRS